MFGYNEYKFSKIEILKYGAIGIIICAVVSWIFFHSFFITIISLVYTFYI